MQKVIFTLIVAIIISNTLGYRVNAATNEDVDYEELSKYDGFAKTMYESLVETQLYVAGKHTDNVDYVKETASTIKKSMSDFADRWENDILVDDRWDRLGNVLAEVAGGAITGAEILWDALTFWKNEDEKNEDVPNIPVNPYVTCVVSDCSMMRINEPYRIKFSEPLNQSVNSMYSGRLFSARIQDNDSGIVEVSYDGSRLKSYEFGTTEKAESFYEKYNDAFSLMVALLNKYGVTVSVYDESLKEEEVITKVTNNNTNLNTIYNYIQSGQVAEKIPDDYKPNITSKLICNSSTHQLFIHGSEFKLSDGTVIKVAYDGSATHNGEQCHLEWVKPIVEYDDKQNVIIDDGEKKLDLEQNLPSDCDSIFCFLTKILDSLTDLVTSILDGILSLFVPEDFSFVTEQFNRITDTLIGKISIVEDFKNMLKGLFVDNTTNPLKEITLDLPILDKPLQFGNVSFIETGVPILRKVISAIVVLYTVLYVYRKITGRGGVMEK